MLHVVLTMVFGCAAPAGLDLQTPGVVLDAEPFRLVGAVLDSRGEPMDAPITWSSPDAAVVIDGGSARCTGPADARIVGVAGDVVAEIEVRCRPGARIVAPSGVRAQVGAALDIAAHVDAAGWAVDLPVELTAGGPEIEVTDAGVFGVGPGRTQLVARAGPLSATIDVEIVEPFPHDRIYVVAAGAGLVEIDRTGRVTQRHALPGLQRKREGCGADPCAAFATTVIDTAAARVAWLQVGGVVVSDAGVLGSASPDGAIGVVGGRWAWSSDGVIRLEDGSTIELPARSEFVSHRPEAGDWPIRFAGGDAAGNACVVGGRKYYGSDDGLKLLCSRDSLWVEQPHPFRSGFHSFGGLVAGGAAAAWAGNYKYDCGLGNCGGVVPVGGLGSSWPATGVGWGGGRAVGGGRVAEDVAELSDLYLQGLVAPVRFADVGSVTPDGAVPDVDRHALVIRTDRFQGFPARGTEADAWRPLAMSPDGELLLVAHRESADVRVVVVDELIARRAGVRSHRPLPSQSRRTLPVAPARQPPSRCPIPRHRPGRAAG